ncbi:MAG: Panacea domain-containing protein [Terriglobales bacterium]
MTHAKPARDESKLRELIIYVSTISERDDSFGAIKLNKLLFQSDFTAYARWGKPLTGVDYFALENGPAPRPMKRLLKVMTGAGDIVIRKSEYFGYEQHRVFPLREAHVSKCFNVEEINLVFRLIQHYWGRSGQSMSRESHEFLGWSVAKLEETIPYSVALVGDRDPTLDEISRGLELEPMALECLARNAAKKVKGDRRGTQI